MFDIDIYVATFKEKTARSSKFHCQIKWLSNSQALEVNVYLERVGHLFRGKIGFGEF